MNRFSKFGPWGLRAIIFGIMLITVSCGTTSSKSNSSQMRILHISPGEPNLDLLIDNTAVSTGIAYGAPTPFVTIGSGTRDLKVKQSNTSNTLYEILKEPFVAGTTYTYLIVGTAPNSVGQKLTDDHTTATTGNFKIRVINGSPDSGPVDVYILTPGLKDCKKSPMTPIKPTIPGLASLGSSTYQVMPSGAYEIVIAAQGVTDTCLLPMVVQSFSNAQNRTFVMYNAIPNTNGPYTSLILTDLN